MKCRNWFLLLAVALVGCSPSESAIQTAIAMTQAAFPTNTAIPSITPIPDEILDGKGSWMRLVPAGEFIMGSEKGLEDEKPNHRIYLDTYYIDKYEVANVFYAGCVKDGVCDPPKKLSSATQDDYYKNPKFELYPVIYVDYSMAKTYCEWRGAKLPTEAQWEKAARGVDERVYPWGDGVSKSVANYDSTVGDTPG